MKFPGRIAMAVMAVVALMVGGLVGCASTRPTIGPGASTAPSASAAPPSAETTATPSATPSATANPADAVAVLQVVCDGTRTDIPASLVRTQPDGVHVRVANTSGRTLDSTVSGPSGSGSSDPIPVDGASFVLTDGPGRYRFACGDASSPFTVVDPDGLYVPVTCADPGSGTIGTSDYGEGATGAQGSVVDIARAQLRGLKPGDLVQRAGYSASSDAPSVRVVRGEVVLAVLTYVGDGSGGWLLSVTRTCPGSDITVAAPDTSG